MGRCFFNGSKRAMTNKNKYLFVGDSRMVGMAVSVHKVRHGKKLARKDGTNDAVGVGNDGNFYFASGATDIKFLENSYNLSIFKINKSEKESDYLSIKKLSPYNSEEFENDLQPYII